MEKCRQVQKASSALLMTAPTMAGGNCGARTQRRVFRAIFLLRKGQMYTQKCPSQSQGMTLHMRSADIPFSEVSPATFSFVLLEAKPAIQVSCGLAFLFHRAVAAEAAASKNAGRMRFLFWELSPSSSPPPPGLADISCLQQYYYRAAGVVGWWCWHEGEEGEEEEEEKSLRED